MSDELSRTRSSSRTRWRLRRRICPAACGSRARDAGALAGLTAPRGRKPRDRRDRQIAELQAEKKRLEQELARARFVVTTQVKLHALLETLSESADTEPRLRP